MSARIWTDERMATLSRAIADMWGSYKVTEIADRLGVSGERVRIAARRMGLSRRRAVAQARGEHRRRVSDIMRREAMRLPDPVRLVPSPTMFGAPIRVLDDNTRALIDKALRRRGRKGQRP